MYNKIEIFMIFIQPIYLVLKRRPIWITIHVLHKTPENQNLVTFTLVFSYQTKSFQKEWKSHLRLSVFALALLLYCKTRTLKFSTLWQFWGEEVKPEFLRVSGQIGQRSYHGQPLLFAKKTIFKGRVSHIVIFLFFCG